MKLEPMQSGRPVEPTPFITKDQAQVLKYGLLFLAVLTVVAMEMNGGGPLSAYAELWDKDPGATTLCHALGLAILKVVYDGRQVFLQTAMPKKSEDIEMKDMATVAPRSPYDSRGRLTEMLPLDE